ncbi:MAG: hypothetical protein H0X02_11920 [Nitrosomonas sp.]|nr:hypothetical protein [Nitrosomonas sp.]
MNLKTRDVEAALDRKGFTRSTGDHNYFIYFVGDKKTSVFTKTSYGQKDIGDSLIGQMAKQCKLSKKDFLRLVECTLPHDGYHALLVEGRHV